MTRRINRNPSRPTCATIFPFNRREAIANQQAKLDKLNGKKARAVKDGAEDREPSKAVFEELLADASKLDKNGMIRVRDWKTTMRPAVVKFANEDPDYVVVPRGPHRFIKRATQVPVNPELPVVAEIPAVKNSEGVNAYFRGTSPQ
ncbi:MAG: hypothetical protein WCI20_11365 [bacterium]